MRPIRQQGYELLQEGLIELSFVEACGIKIDQQWLQKTKDKLRSQSREIKETIQRDNIWKFWKRRFGTKANITSLPQLGAVLYEDFKYEATSRTKTGRPQVNEENLQKIDLPIIKQYSRMLKYEKAYGTFLRGIEKEIAPDGRLHPFFNLHIARTYRSSSNEPNFQNFPVRDKEIAEMIRRCFIASKNCVLIENDFKGIEVALSAAYHKDPEFISYITTPGKDMHRDMAAQIYCMEPSEVHKDVRYGAKNKFVFPQFYGDYYVSCAKALWDWIGKGKLVGPNGIPLYDHLEAQGISELGACDPEQEPAEGTFEKHLQEVEDDFWNRRFRVYGQWKRDWYKAYLEKGYFDTLTGFRIEGLFSRNQVTNYCVQGSAFHCLLWCLIQINKQLRKYQMRSRIVGQIHDSMVSDVRIRELRDFLAIVEDTTMVLLPKHYKWLVVPPEIEYEICPRGCSWFEKKEMKFKGGSFLHPTKPNRRTTDPLLFLNALERHA